MVGIVSVPGASLVGDPFGAFQRGQSRALAIQQQRQQLQIQQAQAEQQAAQARAAAEQQAAQAQAEAARQEQLQGLLGQITPGQQIPAQLGGQAVQQPGQLGQPSAQAPAGITPIAPPEVSQAPSSAQAMAQLAIQFPQRFEQVNKNLGLITQRQKDEAADFSFKVRNAPFAQRDAIIQQRVNTLQSQGRDSSDTRKLFGIPEQEQNQALDTVQVAALSPKERINLAEGRRGVEAIATSKTQQDKLKADLKASDTTFDRADKLRGEITKASTEFNKLDSAFGRIEATASGESSAAGDISLIFNFMKMNDPGSTVREGEFATAQNATGVSNRIRNQYNNIVKGERLNPEQRQDFFNSSKRIFDRAKEDNKKAVDKIVDIGDQFGVSRDQLLGREQAPTQVGRFTVKAK